MLPRILPLLLLSGALSHAAPLPILFDTDMGNDVDDVLALGLIHNLQTRGHCELLAVTLTKDHPKAAAFTHAVNTFYGRPGIPIGIVRDRPEPSEGRFLKMVDEPGKYPHDPNIAETAPEAISLIRQLLAAREDRSVAIVQVGFFTNLARLLDSPGDEHSPLTGRELAAQKVKVLSLMGGAFRSNEGDNHFIEYNVKFDIPAAQKLAREWPTPMIWSGHEIGRTARYPHRSIEQDYDYVPHHPLKDAYYLFQPPPHDRANYDLTSVLAAVFPDRGYFDLSPRGRVEIDDDGFTRFLPGKDDSGLSQYLIMDERQAARVSEACVHLSVTPPQRKP